MQVLPTLPAVLSSRFCVLSRVGWRVVFAPFFIRKVLLLFLLVLGFSPILPDNYWLLFIPFSS